MVRTANTDKKKSNWHVSEIDPDVEYLIEPLTNTERVEMLNYAPSIRPVGAKKGETAQDTTWLSTMLIKASLKKTKGILDPDNDNRELEFKFHDLKISNRLTVQLCQKEMFDKIPNDLLAEITLLVGFTNAISEEDEEAINFTSSSSSEISMDHVETVTETTTNAESKDEPTGSGPEPT